MFAEEKVESVSAVVAAVVPVAVAMTAFAFAVDSSLLHTAEAAVREVDSSLMMLAAVAVPSV